MRAGAPQSSVPLPNLIRSAVSVVRLTVCDSLSGWRRRRRRRLDLDDSNKGDDVARLRPSPFSLPREDGGCFIRWTDGRLSYLKHYRITGLGFNGVVIDLGHHFETYPNYQNHLKITPKSKTLSQILRHCRIFTTPLNQNPDSHFLNMSKVFQPCLSFCRHVSKMALSS